MGFLPPLPNAKTNRSESITHTPSSPDPIKDQWEDHLVEPLTGEHVQDLLVRLAATLQNLLRSPAWLNELNQKLQRLPAPKKSTLSKDPRNLVRCETGFWSHGETDAQTCSCYLFMRLAHTQGLLVESQENKRISVSRANKIAPRMRAPNAIAHPSDQATPVPLIVRLPGEEIFYILSTALLRSPQGDTLTCEQFATLLLRLSAEILCEQ